MDNEFEQLLGAKVIKVEGTDIYFDNNLCLTVHPYETYLGPNEVSEGESERV
jgi:hypothetical protein